MQNRKWDKNKFYQSTFWEVNYVAQTHYFYTKMDELK